MKLSIEKLYFLLTFAELTGIFTRVFGDAQSGSAGSTDQSTTPLLAGFTLLVGFGTAFLCYPRLREIWDMLLRLRWIFLLYSWMLLSLFWTESFAVTLVSSLHMIMYLFAAALLAIQFDIDDFLRMLSSFLVGAAILSVPAQFILGEGVQDDGAGWSGAFPHKNTLGSCMMIAIVILLVQRRRASWPGLPRTISLLLCAGLLILSQSYTSILAAIVASAFILSRRMESRNRATLFMVVLCGFSISTLLADPFALILAAGGKDSSFTGRDAVWAFSAVAIAQHPLIGYGYNSFWADTDWTLQSLHWSPHHAHNGLLQAWLDLGGIGVFLLGGVLINTWRRARRVRKYGHSMAAAWMLSLLTMTFVHNIAEADLMSVKVVWFLIVLGCVSLVKLEDSARWRHLSGGHELTSRIALLSA